ncbi:phage/plasmid primase, P4 family [Thalassospira lohafexi]|uniref:SF3 helicase domain-containing protein n=1 Tax=Thalassospira lohafexi TaxID=744227 RepID=A0A2N3LB65_9PROT|nr:phage/plasmid primase, P4 family [Thalassospira lohafexi]PKR60071.1 hypothetical protein COO92_01475 [Thalassospira lohafexi]
MNAPFDDVMTIAQPIADREIDADFAYSQDTLATKLAHCDFGVNARYAGDLGKWMLFDGTVWKADPNIQHITAVREFMRGQAAQLKRDTEQAVSRVNDPKDADSIITKGKRKAVGLLHSSTIMSVASLARSNPEMAVSSGDFDADPLLLGTPDGTVDLRTGDLRPAKRDDYITTLTAVSPAPKGANAPTWEKFLDRAFAGDKDLIAFMQKLAGYSLTGMTTEHKLFFAYGTGRNGKSVFINTISGMMGDYAKRASSSVFLDSKNERHPTELAALRSARLVSGSELPAGKAWNESIIKDLTGGDVVSARFMRGDLFEFKPQFSLIIAGNHQPSFKGVDEAIRARVAMIPFTVTIPESERDPDLPNQLEAEWPAILRWAIDGCLMWQREGLSIPTAIKEASEEYLEAEDTLGEFISECLVVDPDARTYGKEMYAAFKDWQIENGVQQVWSSKAMKQALKERGFVYKRLTGGAMGFVGVRPKIGC